MEESLALIIVGGVLSFMGIVMNAIPIKFDDDILGTLGALDGDASENEKIIDDRKSILKNVQTIHLS